MRVKLPSGVFLQLDESSDQTQERDGSDVAGNHVGSSVVGGAGLGGSAGG